MTTLDIFLLSTAALIMLCVLASKASARLGIPTLVVFIAVGVMAGSEGIGGIHFDNAYYAQTLGIVALAYILFSGGLDTKWSSITPVLRSGISLSTLGVLFTSGLVGVFAYYALSFTLLESFLIGAIISSTDAGAVFTVLRSKNIHLKNNLKPLLELESGSNDPMAVFLTTLILSLMKNSEASILNFIPMFFSQMIVGAVVGYVAGRFTVLFLNKVRLEFEGLYTVLSIAFVLLIYSLTQSLHGNGFLAVYVAGVVLGNSNFVFKKSIILMHDGLSWLMQSCLFLTLGLLIYPSKIMPVSGMGVVLACFLILIARPASVFIALSFSKLQWRQKLLLSWVGLRGSVPIVLATYPLVAGVERADLIFNLVFFVALTSLIVQGSTIHFFAKLLKVDDPQAIEEEANYLSSVRASDLVPFKISANAAVCGKTIIDLCLPQDVLVVLIEREGKTMIPRGSTQLQKSDKLHVLAEEKSLELFRGIITAKRTESESV